MIATLLKIEFIKLFHSRGLRALSIFCLVAVLLMLPGLSSYKGDFDFFDLGMILAPLFLIIFFVMLVTISISNTCYEFSSNMMKQQIITGISRNQFLLTRAISNAILSIYFSMIFVLISMIFAPSGINIIKYTFHVLFTLFFVLTIASSFAVFFKRTGISMALMIGYYLFIEPLIYYLAIPNPEKALKFFSTKSFIGLFSDKSGEPLNAVFSCVLIMLILFALQSFVIKKRVL